ncbi:myb-related transcription factor, partner of profilin isoform X2 [Spea bombifrons]|uniref:myb-related transcription factor, partner of profilin isoform X2 n=1 Tax=Spea bombifrons TaxID=233779 RepID=UPI00234A8413|nr:myb-related transcription factor, partner of profilin isoform X2 [Spea bombifrons]
MLNTAHIVNILPLASGAARQSTDAAVTPVPSYAGNSGDSGMSGDTEEVTRLRKPRFSYEENQILIREVRANYPLLYGAQSRRLSVAERRQVWEGIAAQINALTNWKRTAQEVQKRWNDFKRRTKEKLARVPHSTQSGTPEEALTAEEETIFAILGPEVMSEKGHYSSDARLRGMDYHQPGTGSSSPETSLSGPCGSQDAPLMLRPKGSPSPTTQLHIVQLPHLTPSPDPSEGPSPPPPPGAGSPLLSPNGVSSHFDPSVAMLRAQQETADAIRHLTYTLRQSMDRLTNVLAAILPLVPTQPPASPAASGIMPPVYYPTKTEPDTEPCCPIDYEDDVHRDVAEDEIQKVIAEPPESPPPPNKRKRFGYLTPRKRRGRWKSP